MTEDAVVDPESAEPQPVEPDEDAVVAEDTATPDLEARVWIVHPDVAIPNQVTRRVARDVWADSGWREATRAESKRFDGQLVDGLRPTVKGDAEPIPEQTEAFLPEPMLPVRPVRPAISAAQVAALSVPVPVSDEKTKTSPSRRAPKSKD